jgi:hypothetical protein
MGRRGERVSVRDLAARFRPSDANSLSSPSNQRAQGMPGARCTRGLVCRKLRNWRTRAYRAAENTPTSPAQWLYGLLRALPGERACLPPSPLRSLLLRNLAPASRRQDHTTSPYAFVHSSALARLNKSVHRISSQRTVTTADAPLRDETARYILLIYRIVKQNIFNFGA